MMTVNMIKMVWKDMKDGREGVDDEDSAVQRRQLPFPTPAGGFAELGQLGSSEHLSVRHNLKK